MILSTIVATSENNVIGIDNDLPWHLPNDLRYFKKRTTNHAIIMGRNTFESIGKALPNRENIVITRNPNFTANGIVCFDAIEHAVNYCEDKAFEEAFFIGGAQIYKECIRWSDKLYITEVHTTIKNGTAVFPEVNWDDWEEIEKEYHEKDDKNAFDHTFIVYHRRSE